ncbi:putative carboxyl-terminal-processing protease, deltaproteobacterial [Delftia tsuruhatensis]|uniref:hypothetical protein n=1 Tax=Delftia tsuruhatensis TaxID=180282 RepID=UPI001E6D9207|nr:hypothetical protein [Delftia tsuruhatensis]CAB5659507.1 putative carboxyl-terminal-processing protease, deltaproteobacterial [Delftia tsuruhatensis]CAC9679666.1 putative carboxyl-terminal-processing protease, deltaproteobacterial [Delftia tsuruhatensis]
MITVSTLAVAAMAASMGSAIVVQDQASLRASPRDGAQQQASLWQGEVLEVRGERLDYLQVWDHKRERGGFIRASDVRRVDLTEAEAPALLAVLRFMQETPGAEALGIGLAAAYLQAAPAKALAGAEGVQAFDALGGFADRLARRASAAAPGKASGATLSAHLDVAQGYGLRFATHEVEGRMQVCYEGEFFRRVLAMPSADAPQRARAALALTRPECVSPDLPVHERAGLLAWQTDVLERVDVAGLPGYLRNRVQMRRASVWSAMAFQQARKNAGDPAVATSAARALAELTGVGKAELPDEDQSEYNNAAMRVSAVRWALVPTPAAAAMAPAGGRPTLLTEPGAPGETCVLLVDARHDAKAPLLRRCTYGVVWTASASTNREGSAVALAVQPMEGWRELWVLRKTEAGWLADVLPPAATVPEIGVAEWAGWVPGGQRMLVARESRGQGRYRKAFEVLMLDGLTTERVTHDVSALPLFQRWQDPAWKRQTLSLR